MTDTIFIFANKHKHMLIPGYKKNSKTRKSSKMREYNITYADIAKNFGYLNAQSFNASSKKRKIIKGIDYIICIVEQHLRDIKE